MTSRGPVDEWSDSSGAMHHGMASSEPFRPTLVVESKEGVSVNDVRFDHALDEAFQTLMRGLAVHALPLDVTNINDMACDEKGRHWLWIHGGRILIATASKAAGWRVGLALP